MKSCELCKQRARIHCASDQANLCWGCDARVHSANFLVARHTRGLLCNVCQGPTPWSASGSKLGPTAFVCEKCVDRGAGSGSSGDDSPSSAEEAEEVEANQVVPWSPPTDHSSSSVAEAVISGKRCCTGVSSGNSGSNFLQEDEISSSSFNTFGHPTPAARAMGSENADAEEVYCCSR